MTHRGICDSGIYDIVSDVTLKGYGVLQDL
jgi:hypothetical protein